MNMHNLKNNYNMFNRIVISKLNYRTFGVNKNKNGVTDVMYILYDYFRSFKEGKKRTNLKFKSRRNSEIQSNQIKSICDPTETLII